jgi:hypothetical protein
MRIDRFASKGIEQTARERHTIGENRSEPI